MRFSLKKAALKACCEAHRYRYGLAAFGSFVGIEGFAGILVPFEKTLCKLCP